MRKTVVENPIFVFQYSKDLHIKFHLSNPEYFLSASVIIP